jgi:hypothetical protein
MSEVDNYGKSELDKIVARLSSIVSNLPESDADHYYYTGIRQLFRNDGLSARRCFDIALILGCDDETKVKRHLENLKKRR